MFCDVMPTRLNLGFTGVFFFCITAIEHRMWVVVNTTFLTSIHNQCFELIKKYRNFYLKNLFSWSLSKNRSILHSRVKVVITKTPPCNIQHFFMAVKMTIFI